MIKKLKSLFDLCFRILVTVCKNNPCAIEQLLIPPDLKYLERIFQEFPTEIWFTLYTALSSENDEDEVFTMSSNQMLKLGNALIGLVM